MSTWTITSMNLPSASTAADPEHVATCSIASCSRQCRLIRSPTEISRAGKRTQTTTYSGYESELDSHFREFWPYRRPVLFSYCQSFKGETSVPGVWHLSQEGTSSGVPVGTLIEKRGFSH